MSSRGGARSCSAPAARRSPAGCAAGAPPARRRAAPTPRSPKAFTEGATTGRFSPESVEFFRSRGPGAAGGPDPRAHAAGPGHGGHALHAPGVDGQPRHRSRPTACPPGCSGSAADTAPASPTRRPDEPDRGRRAVVAASGSSSETRRVARRPPFSLDRPGRQGAPTAPPSRRSQRGELRATGSGTLALSPGDGNGTPDRRLPVPGRLQPRRSRRRQDAADLVGAPRAERSPTRAPGTRRAPTCTRRSWTRPATSWWATWPRRSP